MMPERQSPDEGQSMVSALAALTIVSLIGWQVSENQDPDPGSRPQYTEDSSEEVREKVNKLIADAEQACLTTGTIDGEDWKRQRYNLLGKNAGSVRVLCKQVRDRKDRVFVVQIGDAACSTADGKRYFPAERIPAPKNID